MESLETKDRLKTPFDTAWNDLGEDTQTNPSTSSVTPGNQPLKACGPP